MKAYLFAKASSHVNDFNTAGLLSVSILYKSTAGRFQPVRVADAHIIAHYRLIKNASWVVILTTVITI